MRLFEAGRLLTFSTFRMGAYSRWALIRGWALIRINTVACLVGGDAQEVLYTGFVQTPSVVLRRFLSNICNADIHRIIIRQGRMI